MTGDSAQCLIYPAQFVECSGYCTLDLSGRQLLMGIERLRYWPNPATPLQYAFGSSAGSHLLLLLTVLGEPLLFGSLLRCLKECF